MNRTDVEQLLRLRWTLTGERLGDQIVDAWTDELEHVDTATAFKALRDLVRGGATKVTLGHLFAHLPATKPGDQPPAPTKVGANGGLHHVLCGCLECDPDRPIPDHPHKRKPTEDQ